MKKIILLFFILLFSFTFVYSNEGLLSKINNGETLLVNSKLIEIVVLDKDHNPLINKEILVILNPTTDPEKIEITTDRQGLIYLSKNLLLKCKDIQIRYHRAILGIVPQGYYSNPITLNEKLLSTKNILHIKVSTHMYGPR